MNLGALVAVIVFAGALLLIFGALYIGALRSYKRGELEIAGVKVLRWAFLGHVALYVLLAITAFVT